MFITYPTLCKCLHTMGLPLLAKALTRDGLSGKGLLLLTITPFELLIIFIFQTPHICWLIIALPITIYVFASAFHSHIPPLEVAVGCVKFQGRQVFCLCLIAITYLQKSHMTFLLTLEEYAWSRTSSHCEHRMIFIS